MSGSGRSGAGAEGIAPPGDAAPPANERRGSAAGAPFGTPGGLELPLIGCSGSALGSALAALTTRVVDWFVMTDELLYERLAISVGRLHSPLPHVHGELIANVEPALPAADRAALPRTATCRSRSTTRTSLNAFVMSSACIPAFLLARRVTGQPARRLRASRS